MLTRAVSAPELACLVIVVPPLTRLTEFSLNPAALAAAAASKAA